MKLSLIIPAYNEEGYLADCLRHAQDEIARQSSRGPFEIIVINNASTDRTAEIAAGFAGVRVVTEQKKGLTHARQRGLDEARGEILAYIDADTRMAPGWLARVLDLYQAKPDAVCVSGPYAYYDLAKFKSALVRLYWLMLAKPTYLFTQYMAVGGNFAARRDALLNIGGFDTNIAFYGEDTNIARRLAEVGRVVFDLGLVMPTSARRLDEEGFVTTAMRYVVNFMSEVVLKRPSTSDYRDVR
ncbi:MAG: glycosyltransferase family 2 protein [Paludibacterium sp.]|uniref:glycosyltransferase family 2 protein n=1 Tax=Paludibacterium sp. TaxID=1917523 RepID=UPI0025EB83AA|nr:glycosyltransferase family A protein [Paludibacterium sp.]MBV8045773.1 glycosyltransferase family 2 protein [Paludibacterium sp.]MBV8646380.1 glycosyltransferase family 2 protein [Paludibacterium sp.]